MTKLSQEDFQKIRKIQIHTSQLVNEILAGAWHSAFKGRGIEFEEVREYQSGDEVRSIDWNVTARMHHPYVKVFREERELTVVLLVDVSASSRFGSQNHLKRDLIAEIGAALTFSAIRNSDKVGLILFSDFVEKYIPPKKGVRHVLRVIRELLAYTPQGKGTNLLSALDFAGGVLKKSAICFLISDFICSLYQKEMSILAKKHDLIAINITDPYEMEFPEMGLVNIIDLETGEFHTINTSNQLVLEHFKNKNVERRNDVEWTMKTIGAGFLNIRTDEPYLPVLHKFFKTREIKH
jgi:uncharacterized protein (DUF58 family)